MKVLWSLEAVYKMEEIENFIARDSPGRAEKLIEHLIDQGESISDNPLKGRIVPEFSVDTIRELIVKNYRIVYRVKNDVIEILTVFEGHQLLRIDETEAKNDFE